MDILEFFEASLLNISVLATLFFWGAWGIFDKLALRYAAPMAVMIAINCLVPFLPPLIYYFLAEKGLLSNITPEVLFWSFLAGLSYFVAMLLYLWALNIAEASFVLGITSAYPVVLQFLSTATLNEPLVPVRIVGSFLSFVGVMAIGFSRKKMNSGLKTDLKTGSTWALWTAIFFTTVLWGIWGIFDKKALNLCGAIEVMFCQVLFDLLFTLVLLILVALFVTSKNEKLKSKYQTLLVPGKELVSFHSFIAQFKQRRIWIPCLLSSICLYAGAATYLVALSRATASYVVVITGCYPLIMYFFALLLLKEGFNRIRFLGIVLITVGAILTQTTQRL